MSKLIICFCIIISTSYGLIYNKTRNKKENKNGMWLYYTNVSNLIVVLFSILLSVYFFTNDIILKSIITNPILEYSIMMIITITMLIYHFMLRNNMKEKEGNSIFFKIQNRCLHYVTPILVIIYWLIYSKKKSITQLSCLYWIIIPLIYLLIIIIRSRFIGLNSEKKKYPYNFIDIDILGKKKFCINIFSILFTFILISEIIYMLIKYI